MLKEKLALLSCEGECQIVQEATSQSPKRKKKKTALAILLGEDEDDDPEVFTTSEEFEGNSFKILRKLLGVVV